MEEAPRSGRERLVHGCCGAFLAGIATLFWSQLLSSGINGWIVGLWALVGFVVAWFFGEEAIEFLKWVFWWY